jgi:PhnB protein
MEITAHLSFDGTCEQAFRFYADTLGGTLQTLMRWGQMPMSDIPPELSDKIGHATLRVGAATLMGNDVRHEDYAPLQGFAITLGVPDLEAAERIFDALAADGTVALPLAATFWSLAFGIVVDRFGVTWEINCEQSADGAPAT